MGIDARDLGQRGKRQARALRDMFRRSSQRRDYIRQRHQASPGFRDAVSADVDVTLTFRGEGRGPLSRTEKAAETVRLIWVSDAFLGQVLYRARVTMLRRGIPVLPRVCHGLSMATSQICIGDPVVLKAGVYIPHGALVLDGITEIGSGTILAPFATVGLVSGIFQGPTIDSAVQVGTGARILGPRRIGPGARIGANAVVVADVAPQSVVVGVPAKPKARGRT